MSAARTTHSPSPSHLRTSRSLAEPDGFCIPTKVSWQSLVAKSCGKRSPHIAQSLQASLRFRPRAHSPASRHRRTFGSLAELDGPLAIPTKSRANSRAEKSMRGRGRSASLGERSVAAHSPTASHLPKFESSGVSPIAKHATRRHAAISESLEVGEPPQFTLPRS